jgi:hypothetical protein
MTQRSRREPSWLGTEEVANIVVGAEWKVGTGGVAAFFVDVCRGAKCWPAENKRKGGLSREEGLVWIDSHPFSEIVD